ncbi:uncharacterized protein (DUF1697 family) [Catalinimonas alkaloidigena]|uniref:DUF1697 domain-containing protein n=1 Tax=Catalinimonas alkaloidigena TaxID=1075417 RepID=UPI002404C9AC|nr:DUF1697 domain-containing protein [Catalinimonas alkaloidigena]MDF9797050.1 uncharacterized protein (DUF1697 family) [Catalinimonas alkaloidigena]
MDQEKTISYAAFLRGINVGGHRKIKMQELKSSLTKIGLQDIETYIQSGNVVFKSTESNLYVLRKQFEALILDHFGFEVKVLLRNQKQVNEVLLNNPYLKGENNELSKCYVTLLTEVPESERAELLNAITFSHDEFYLMKDTVYLHCLDGYGRTKLSNDFFEKKLTQFATTRNWKTMLRIQNMLSA